MVLMPRVYKEDKQIEQDVETTHHRLLEQNVCISRFGKTRGRALPPIERHIMLLTEKIERQDLTIEYLVQTVKSLQGIIEKRNKMENREIASSRNSETLRAIFNLPALSNGVHNNPLKELKGFLKDYSDKKTDSVELLRIARGE